MKFDFKKYHFRAMNAPDEASKQAINQELKDLYASLNEAEQKAFNEELQQFLIRQYADLTQQVEALKTEEQKLNN